MNFPKVYLASSSPRRRELLTQIGVEFDVLSIETDETRLTAEAPINYVQRVAKAKAVAGWHSLTDAEKRPVIGSDTSVVLVNDVLGKPDNAEHAKLMLKKLSNHQHQVMTSVALAYNHDIHIKTSLNTVTFNKLSDEEIDWYIGTGEGQDKAGSYAVQGLAAMFIKQISGSYSGIMGLPLRETSELLWQHAAESEKG